MKITIIGRGNIGGGIDRLWTAAGHHVTALGRDGGDASGSDAVVVAVPSRAIPDALAKVSGVAGLPTIDACNAYGPGSRDETFSSLAHQIKALIGGPTAKSFNTNFAAAYDHIADQRVPPSNLFASDPAARELTELLMRDAGFDPVFVGDLDAAARLLEDRMPFNMALAQQIGPFFYRYARPGDL
jgi:predicted dinucleotide-binding enzyme